MCNLAIDYYLFYIALFKEFIIKICHLLELEWYFLLKKKFFFSILNNINLNCTKVARRTTEKFYYVSYKYLKCFEEGSLKVHL